MLVQAGEDFERDLKSRDPNWVLAHVDAADA